MTADTPLHGLEGDLHTAALLCEAAYRSHFSAPELARYLASVRGGLLAAAEVEKLSAHLAGDQRYVVGHGPSAIYVAFQGTKDLTDWGANLSVRHAPLWRRRSSSSGNSNSETTTRQHPAAHAGFSRRSTAVPLLELQAAARASGKRLVLCGHSLGGAVAMIATVTLLRGEAEAAKAAAAAAPEAAIPARKAAAADGLEDEPRVRCVAFAAPPVANEALAAEVSARGWHRYICNFVLPEDPVVPVVNRLLRARAVAAADRFWSDSTPSSGSKKRTSDATAAGSDAGSDDDTAAAQDKDEIGSLLNGRRRRSSSSSSSSGSSTGSRELLLPVGMLVLEQAEAAAAASYVDEDEQESRPAGPKLPVAGPALMAAAAAAASAAAAGRLSIGGAGIGPFSGIGAAFGGGSRGQRFSAWPLPWQHSWPEAAAPLRQHLASWAPQQQTLRQRPRLQQSLISATAPALGGDSTGAHDRLVRQRPGAAFVAAVRMMRVSAQRAIARGLRRAARFAALASSPRILLPSLAAAAPRLSAAMPPLLGALLPAVAGLELIGSALLAITVPRSRHIGSQFVLSHDGVLPADRPLAFYPRRPNDLGLHDLGGLFKSHRMIAYRNRLSRLAAAAAAARERVPNTTAATGRGGVLTFVA